LEARDRMNRRETVGGPAQTSPVPSVWFGCHELVDMIVGPPQAQDTRCDLVPSAQSRYRRRINGPTLATRRLPVHRIPVTSERGDAPASCRLCLAGGQPHPDRQRISPARPRPVAQIANLPCRRLAVGDASVQTSASPPAHASRITNPRYGRLPACATSAEAAVAGMTAQTSSERGASLRAKGRRPTGGAMLRAPSVAQIANLPYRRLAVGGPAARSLRDGKEAAVAGGAMLRAPSVAQIANLPCRRLAVGDASVQTSALPPAHGSRITNPRYGRLPACATDRLAPDTARQKPALRRFAKALVRPGTAPLLAGSLFPSGLRCGKVAGAASGS
jgi:hypothetical protein